MAKDKGRLRGRPRKLTPQQEAHLVELWTGGRHTGAEIAALFGVARATVYRAIRRAALLPAPTESVDAPAGEP